MLLLYKSNSSKAGNASWFSVQQLSLLNREHIHAIFKVGLLPFLPGTYFSVKDKSSNCNCHNSKTKRFQAEMPDVFKKTSL